MDEPGKSTWVLDWLWFLALGAASSLWCWTAARELSATFDEPIYITRGLEGWRTGSHQGLVQLGTMPLPVDVCTLPLYVWERWHGIRFDPVGGLARLLPWARAGTLLFWWLLLAYARLAGRQLAGPWGGRLAAALIACEPILLAHASLATTDIAISACLLALVYHYRMGRDKKWFWRVGVPAFWFAAALLAKASGLVFGLVCLCAVELEYLATVQPRRAALLQPFRRDLAQIVAGGLFLTFLYCGTDWKAEPSFVEWAHRLPDSTNSRALVWLADHLRIFSNAGEGLVRQVKHNVRGHGTYLLGQMADRAIWYYFPVALTIKLSLPCLMLPLVLAVVRPRLLANWACLAALALLALSAIYRVQIGVRLVLPLVALAIIGLSAAAVNAYRSLSARGSAYPPGALARALPCALALFLVAGVLWTASAALRVWPHGLCYTNELWGGTREGYFYLSDSNYDWGQGLKELARWQRQHRETPLDVWYFGSDPSLEALPMREIPFHTQTIKRPEEFLAQVRGHHLAVSTSLLYGSIRCSLRSNRAAVETYDQVSAVLRGCRPVDRTTTFLIYDFTESAKNGSSMSQALESVTKGPADHRH